MSNKSLDELMNDYLKTVAHGNALMFKAIYLAKDILDAYSREDILKNLGPLSRNQTGLIQWAQAYFKEQSE